MLAGVFHFWWVSTAWEFLSFIYVMELTKAADIPDTNG
jgi:hypothetical protein